MDPLDKGHDSQKLGARIKLGHVRALVGEGVEHRKPSGNFAAHTDKEATHAIRRSADTHNERS